MCSSEFRLEPDTQNPANCFVSSHREVGLHAHQASSYPAPLPLLTPRFLVPTKEADRRRCALAHAGAAAAKDCVALTR